jgi:fatty acid amide hydrolase 2
VPPSDSLLTSSATQLAARIRRRELTSEEVVAAHVARARATHGRVRAIVVERYERALEEAREVDRRLARSVDDVPAFMGVPCTVKESFAFEGMPQTAGLVSRKGLRASGDAPTVARLRAAGAIPLGVTNTSELCMWMESHNEVYGRTNNPYDPGRIAGGSSGGEGAAVGAGASPFGLGSDIGGSIRMPAFFCGVFGHKPSVGLVPNEGQYPAPHGEATRLLGTGPLARRAEDLWPLLEVLAGRRLEHGPRDVSLSGLTVLDVASNGRLRVSRELRDAQERAASALARRGARVLRWSSGRLEASLEIWAARMAAAGGPSFAELLGGDGPPVRPLRELARRALGRSPHTLPAIGLALVELAPKLLPDASARYLEAGRLLKAELDDALRGDAVLLYPSYTRTAPRHGEPLLFPIEWMYTAVINALELPATQVPLGLGAAGTPLGVQVVGGHGGDARTVAVALALEEAFGGWVAPA